jgi:N-acyl-D-amino-acid deacylase
VATAEYAWLAGERLDAVAERLGMETGAAVLHILQHEGPAVSAIYFSLSEEDVAFLMASPYQCVCTDGLTGAHAHPRAYASFPRFLGHYVRDRKLLPLETAIRRITMEPARRLRLWDRGLIREGMAADLVLFDFAAIGSANSYLEPAIPPVGIEKVWVRGDLKFSAS